MFCVNLLQCRVFSNTLLQPTSDGQNHSQFKSESIQIMIWRKCDSIWLIPGETIYFNDFARYCSPRLTGSCSYVLHSSLLPAYVEPVAARNWSDRLDVSVASSGAELLRHLLNWDSLNRFNRQIPVIVARSKSQVISNTWLFLYQNFCLWSNKQYVQSFIRKSLYLYCIVMNCVVRGFFLDDEIEQFFEVWDWTSYSLRFDKIILISWDFHFYFLRSWDFHFQILNEFGNDSDHPVGAA